jgi:hypothetical protein
MAIIGLHFAAQPAQVQNRVDLAQEMIVRNHLFQIEVIEKTIKDDLVDQQARPSSP